MPGVEAVLSRVASDVSSSSDPVEAAGEATRMRLVAQDLGGLGGGRRPWSEGVGERWQHHWMVMGSRLHIRLVWVECRGAAYRLRRDLQASGRRNFVPPTRLVCKEDDVCSGRFCVSSRDRY